MRATKDDIWKELVATGPADKISAEKPAKLLRITNVG